RLVIGKVIVDKPDRKIDWSWGSYSLHPKPATSDEGGGPLVVGLHEVVFNDRRGAQRRSSVVRSEHGKMTSYPVLVSADGSFRVEDVPPGEYLILFLLREPPDSSAAAPHLEKEVGQFGKVVSVPPADEVSRGPVDLGTYIIPIVQS